MIIDILQAMQVDYWYIVAYGGTINGTGFGN